MKLGVIGIIIEKDKMNAQNVNKLLSENSQIIIGRMGVPDAVNGVSVISVIVKGSNEEISSLSGKLGRLENVKVKSATCDI